MKKILVLGAGPIQTPVIKKIRELGYYSIVLDYDPLAEGASYADEFYPVSTTDLTKVLQLAQEHSINGILTTSDYPVNVVAEVSRQLKLPAMSVDVARICTNKYQQREFFFNNNINTPKFILIKDREELESVDFFPCVIKPVDSSASRGVKKVFTKKELYEQYPISREYAKSKNIIVEEFIDGREFSVETLTQNGQTHIIQVTEKLTLGNDIGYFVEDTHIVPARIGKEEYDEIKKLIFEIAEKLGINNCPTHTEIKLNSRGVFIIEIACRLGGDYITSDLVPLSTGVDMLKNLIFISIGESISVECSKEEVASIQFLNPSNYKRCSDFFHTGNQYIVRGEIKEYKNSKIKDSNDRLGYIILNTPTMTIMEDILTMIK
jgi:carbamoyl-phosphate synthase large subunit